MRILSLFICYVLFFSYSAKAQEEEIDYLIQNELKMTFPSIYFKHNSLSYAPMPYSVDSCLKYIALNINDISDLVIWQDSSETEVLVKERMRKIRRAFKRYKETRNITIIPIQKKQKIASSTISKTTDESKVQYLLSLNSVFEISKTRISPERKWWQRRTHKEGRYLCYACWQRGAFNKENRQKNKRKKKNNSTVSNPNF